MIRFLAELSFTDALVVPMKLELVLVQQFGPNIELLILKPASLWLLNQLQFYSKSVLSGCGWRLMSCKSKWPRIGIVNRIAELLKMLE